MDEWMVERFIWNLYFKVSTNFRSFVLCLSSKKQKQNRVKSASVGNTINKIEEGKRQRRPCIEAVGVENVNEKR